MVDTVTGELFDIVQQSRVIKNRPRQTINIRAQVYSLSTLMKCTRCGSSIRIQKNPRGKPRVYCSGRAEGLDCSNRGTFLDIYESQIEWYLERFIIPEDYQTKILDSHRKLESPNDDAITRRDILHNSLTRLKELFKWGHVSKDEYLAQFESIERELEGIRIVADESNVLKKLAHFLTNVGDAWKEASQEQCNKLARSLFEEILNTYIK